MPENEDEMTLSPHGTDGAEPYEPSNEAEPDDDWQGNGSASETGSDSEEPTVPRPATGPRPPVRPLGSEERFADIPEWVSEFRRMYVEPKSGGGGRERTPAPREQELPAEETQARERGRAGRLLRGWRGGRAATPTSPPVEPEPGSATSQAIEPDREWASPVAPVEPTTAAHEQSPSPEDSGPAAHEEPAADEHEHEHQHIEELEPAEEQAWVPSEDAEEDVPVEAMVADEDEASLALDREDHEGVAEEAWVPSEDAEDVPVQAMVADENEASLALDREDHEGREGVAEAAPVDEDAVPVEEEAWVPFEDEDEDEASPAQDHKDRDDHEGVEEAASVDEDVVPVAVEVWVPSEEAEDVPVQAMVADEDEASLALDREDHEGREGVAEEAWVPSEDAEGIPVDEDAVPVDEEAWVPFEDEDEASPAQNHKDRDDHGGVEEAASIDEEVVPVAGEAWVPSEGAEGVPVEAMVADEDEASLARDHEDRDDLGGVEQAAPVDEDVVPVAGEAWVPSGDAEAVSAAESHEDVGEPARADEDWAPADTNAVSPDQVQAQDVDDHDTEDAGPVQGEESLAAVDERRADVGEGDEDLEELSVDGDVVPAAGDAWVPAEDEGEAPDGDEHVAAQGDETPSAAEEHDESADAGHDVLPELAPGDDHDTPPETGDVDDAARDAEPESAAEPDHGDPVGTAPEDASEPDIEAAPEPVPPAPTRPTTGGDVPVDPPAVIRPGADAATERRLADLPVAKATPRVASNPYGIPGAEAPVTPPVARPAPPVRGAAPAAASAPESPAPRAEYMEAIIPPLDEASWREEGAVAPPRRRPRPQPLTAEEKAAEDLAGPPAEDQAPRSRAEAREATRQEEHGTRRIRRRLLLFIVAVLVVVVVVAVTASWMKANGVPLVAPTALDGWVTAMTGPPPGPPAL